LIVIVLISFPLTAQTKIDSAASNKQDTIKFIMQKSATGAMLRSAVIPGWGQFYNESYWKIPVVWGFLGWFAYNAIHQNKMYNDYKPLADADPNTYKRYSDYYRDNRDSFIVYMALTYLVNIVDAYVDAHLFDFDVSETNKSMNYTIKLKIGL
jgi:hypothetical protein